jgi:hypothetical protein
MRRKISLNLQTVSEHLFAHPLKLFDYMHDSRFIRGLPKSVIVAKVFKKAVACNGFFASEFVNQSKELQDALHCIWGNGWLHAIKSKDDTHYIFASSIHVRKLCLRQTKQSIQYS